MSEVFGGKRFGNYPESSEKSEGIEHINIVVGRHGRRGTDNLLTPDAEEKTKAVTERVLADLKENFGIGKEIITQEDIDEEDVRDSTLIKAVGSSSSAKLPGGGVERRAMKTAEIAARYMGENLGAAVLPDVKPRPHMNFEKRGSKAPYEHVPVYNAALGEAMVAAGHLTAEEFDEARKDQKKLGEVTNCVLTSLLGDNNPQEFDRLSYVAQEAAVKAAFTAEDLAAEQFRRESAGAFAQLILRYKNVAGEVSKGMRARRKEEAGALAQKLEKYPERTLPLRTKELMLIAGTHGGTMEWLLQQALVWQDNEGMEHQGIKDIDELKKLGGAFDTSEAYTVRVATKGDVPDNQKYQVILHSAVPGIERPKKVFYLDPKKVEILAADFQVLHNHFNKLDELNRHGFRTNFEAYKKEHGVFYDWVPNKVAPMVVEHQ